MVEALLRMLAVLQSNPDWTMLSRVHCHLKLTAAPSRNKLAHMVVATDLLALGILAD